jgi:hypothetical protein
MTSLVGTNVAIICLHGFGTTRYESNDILKLALYIAVIILDSTSV